MSIELDNSFTVPVPPDVAWKVLLDVARIAPCMPGATVDSVEDDVVTGGIKVKVGPVQLTYRGTATFTERDESTRTIFVDASGKETKGAGTASATVKASLTAAEDGATLVEMHTTMNVTGRPAQFGRGIMVEVGGKLVDKFAANLAVLLAADTATEPAEETAAVSEGAPTAVAPPVAPPVTTSASTPAAAPAPEESLNLVRLIGPAILKRVVPVAAVAAAIALLGRRIRRGVRHGKA
ncbi:MAG TPA: SRPBCC family protein [Streptosporangiaceae bacterium]|nr:SRPBCC family protein [Streptosporangiaceae bacterium]